MFKKSRIKIMALVMSILFAVLAGTLALIYFTTYREVNAQNREMLEMYAQMYAANGSPQADTPESISGTAQEALPESAEDLEASEQENLPQPTQSADVSEQQTFLDPEESADASEQEMLPDPDISADASEQEPLPDTDLSTEDLQEEIDLFLDEDMSRRYMSSTFYSVLFASNGTVLEITNDTMPMLEDDELTALAETLMESGKTFGTRDDVVFLVTEQDDYILVTMMDNTVLGESIDTLIHYTLISGGIFIAAAFVLSFFLSKWIIEPLEISDQKQKQFISDAGHELKTPISTISANAELLSREIGENPWLSNIQYENNRMSVLVRQLLDLARLEQVTPEYVSVDLSHAILSGILPFEGIAFEQGLQMDYEIEEHICIHANEASMGELISILVDNALTHTVPGGHIHISLRSLRNGAILTVSNEGAEIPESEREKIFEPFYRSDASRSSLVPDISSSDSASDGDLAANTVAKETPAAAAAHYGLGLSIAKTIADAHHSRISVSCQDGFTTFEVRFVS